MDSEVTLAADDSFPKNIEQALQSSADDKVLNLLWVITTTRIAEETSRVTSLHERANKYVTYALSLISVSLIILGMFKDDFGLLLRQQKGCIEAFFIAVMVILFVFYFCFVMLAMNVSFHVIKDREWMTWNESDLSRVDLGNDADQRYFRYIILAGWNFINYNYALTNSVYQELSKALLHLRRSAICLFSFLLISFVVKVSFMPQTKGQNYTDLQNSSGEVMKDKKFDEKSGQPVPSKTPAPAPIPQPSTGTPLRKSGDAPTKPTTKK